MDEQRIQTPAQWAVRVLAAAMTGVCALGVAAAGLSLLFFPMMFDSPGSENNRWLWNVAMAPITYVLAFVVSLRWSVQAIKYGNARAFALALGVQGLGVAWVALSWGLLQHFCNGSFSCAQS